MQETWQTTSGHFLKTVPTEPPQTFLILHPADPKDKHAGVGFIVSPKLRPFIINFTSHSSRIASLRIRTQPRPIQIFTIYAPSMIADPPADLLRTENFWQQLHKTYETVPDAIIKILAGDLNVRMHARPASHTEHVGPHI